MQVVIIFYLTYWFHNWGKHFTEIYFIYLNYLGYFIFKHWMATFETSWIILYEFWYINVPIDYNLYVLFVLFQITVYIYGIFSFLDIFEFPKKNRCNRQNIKISAIGLLYFFIRQIKKKPQKSFWIKSSEFG